MAYRFELDEQMDKAFARCAREQLDGAIRALVERIEGDPVEAVHSARKSVKKERALLRLLRGAIGAPERNRESAALRASAHRLTQAREAEILVQTLDGLADRYSGALPAVPFEAVRESLVATRASQRAQLRDKAFQAEVAQELAATRARIAGLALRAGGWRAIEPGLAHTYRQGRKEMKAAREKPAPERLHDWRKRVKDLYYQLRLLSEVCGPTIHGQAKEADRLADLLGDEHDLALLNEAIDAFAQDLAKDKLALMRLVEHRRGQLQAEAVTVGTRLYAEKPSAFTRRIRRSWRAGRKGAHDSRQLNDPAELAELSRAAVA
jgi:CHAD domain-containing protein